MIKKYSEQTAKDKKAFRRLLYFDRFGVIHIKKRKLFPTKEEVLAEVTDGDLCAFVSYEKAGDIAITSNLKNLNECKQEEPQPEKPKPEDEEEKIKKIREKVKEIREVFEYEVDG